MAKDKYKEVAPIISAQLSDAEIDLEIPKKVIKEDVKDKVLTKEAIQEAIQYIKYLGLSVVPEEGLPFVSHGFIDIANKVNNAGYNISKEQVKELHEEWKNIIQTDSASKVEPVVEPVVEPK